MAEEEYDLMPHKEVLELKKQIEQIRKNPIESSPEGKGLVEVMAKLSGSMNNMVDLFKEASEHMKSEGGGGDIEKRLKSIEDQIAEVIDENKKIAKGMIAIADMVREMKVPPRPPISVPRAPPMPPRPEPTQSFSEQSEGPGPMGPTQSFPPRPMGNPQSGQAPPNLPPLGPPPMGPPRPMAPRPMGPPPGGPMGMPPMRPGMQGGVPPLSGPPPMPPQMGPPGQSKKKGLFGFGK